MKAGIFEYYKELPGWAKGTIVVGGIVIVSFTGWKVYKGIQQAVDKAKANKSIADVKGERLAEENKGIAGSFSDSQYQGFASAIQNQFEGCDFSTTVPFFPGKDLTYSGRILYNILSSLKNNVDFLKLVEAWGIRTYDACGIGNGDVINVNLYGAVTDELTSDEITLINDLLKTKGITYTF